MIHKNMSLREAIQVAHEMGVEVRRKKSGELLVYDQQAHGGRPLVVGTHGRKDAGQALVSLLRQAKARRAG